MVENITLTQARLLVIRNDLREAIEKVTKANAPRSMNSFTWRGIFSERITAAKEFQTLATPENILMLLNALEEPLS